MTARRSSPSGLGACSVSVGAAVGDVDCPLAVEGIICVYSFHAAFKPVFVACLFVPATHEAGDRNRLLRDCVDAEVSGARFAVVKNAPVYHDWYDFA